jgi:hypothetical protein
MVGVDDNELLLMELHSNQILISNYGDTYFAWLYL